MLMCDLGMAPVRLGTRSSGSWGRVTIVGKAILFGFCLWMTGKRPVPSQALQPLKATSAQRKCVNQSSAHGNQSCQ